MVSSPSSSSSPVSKPSSPVAHHSSSASRSPSHSPQSSGSSARIIRTAHTPATGNDHVMRGAANGELSQDEWYMSGSHAYPTPPKDARSTFDTSNILYPTLQLHPPPLIHPILVFSLSELALVPSANSNDDVFKVLLRRLEPWVGEQGEGGYILVVLAAQGTAKGRAMPGVGWWAWKWRKIPRKYVRLMR